MKTLKIFLSLICLVFTSLSFGQFYYSVNSDTTQKTTYFTNMQNSIPTNQGLNFDNITFIDSNIIKLNLNSELNIITDFDFVISDSSFITLLGTDTVLLLQNNHVYRSVLQFHNNEPVFDKIVFNTPGTFYICKSFTNYHFIKVIVYPEGEYVSTDNFEMSNIDLVCYPNPVVDYVNVSISEHTNDSVELLDMTGKVIKSVSGSEFNNYVYRFDLTSLPQGVYMIRFRDEIRRVVR